MTVNQMYKKLSELREKGYGEAQVVRLDDCYRSPPYSYGIYAPCEIHDATRFGEAFTNKTKHFVYLDIDEPVKFLDGEERNA